MDQKVVLKSKKERKLSLKQKVALHAIQKQMQMLALKEWLVVIGFSIGGGALRFAMQPFPSVEPITFFAILSGWLFGRKKGFVTGAAAGFLSNFLMFGGQGIWTPFQMLAWGIAGFLGGFIKDIKPRKNYFLFWAASIIPAILIATASTAVFEILMNASWAIVFPFSIIGLIISGLPFLVIHLISNIGFSLMLPFARKFTYEKGKFNEMEICRAIADRLDIKRLPAKRDE